MEEEERNELAFAVVVVVGVEEVEGPKKIDNVIKILEYRR